MKTIHSISLISSEPAAYGDCACSFSDEVKKDFKTRFDSISLLKNEHHSYSDCACSFSEEINPDETAE